MFKKEKKKRNCVEKRVCARARACSRVLGFRFRVYGLGSRMRTCACKAHRVCTFYYKRFFNFLNFLFFNCLLLPAGKLTASLKSAQRRKEEREKGFVRKALKKDDSDDEGERYYTSHLFFLKKKDDSHP
jgi:hypothetical protein